MPIERVSSGTRTRRPDLDEVNDASFDSFPASDAPTWSSMHAGAPRFSQRAAAAQSETVSQPTANYSAAYGEDVPPGAELIEVHVPDLQRVFNAMDPSPLRSKDLDPKVEEFIVSWARAIPRETRLALVIFADSPAGHDETTAVREAIQEFFRQRSLSAGRRLSQLFRVGRTSLLIGVVFLAVAITLAGLVDRALGGSHIAVLIRESIVIGGWVAMWRPLEIFLYDWWSILAERKLFDRLSAAPIRFSYNAAAPPSGS